MRWEMRWWTRVAMPRAVTAYGAQWHLMYCAAFLSRRWQMGSIAQSRGALQSRCKLVGNMRFPRRVVLRARGTHGNVGVNIALSSDNQAEAGVLYAHNWIVPPSGQWVTQHDMFSVPRDCVNTALQISTQHNSRQGEWWIGSISLQPADHFMGMRADVIEALSSLGLQGPLKYPGGCAASYNSWRDGLLPPTCGPS